jgi:hypothetical protein
VTGTPGSAGLRRLEIAGPRFPGWLERLVADHPGAQVLVDGPLTRVDWPGGSAVCEAFGHDPLAVLLVRRGGYAVGLAHGDALVAAKTGRRHVQGRTAAGGWSQQRFARRREGQADALVEAVAGHALRILVREPRAGGRDRAGVGGIPAGLVLAGDRRLAAAVLAEPGLQALRELSRRELYDLPDPDARVLATAVQRARAVRVAIDDPHGPDPVRWR